MTMDLAQLQDTISRVTYWPGWQFKPYADPHLGLMIWIITTQPDRDNPDRTIDLGPRARIPPHALENPREFCRWLLWRLEEAAVHECREGLRYDGELVDDPHSNE